MRQSVALINVQQSHAVLSSLWASTIKPALVAGQRLVLELREANKSREQEEKYHAIIGEIAKAAKAAGKDWDEEDWKRLTLEQFATDTGRPTGKLLPSLDGKRLVQTSLLSRKFGKGDASEFVEWLYAWCADNGVELSQ